MGSSYQQEIDLQTLFKDVASDYVVHVSSPAQIPAIVDRAFRTAMARRAPVALAVHADVQELEYEPPAHEFKQTPRSLDWQPPGGVDDYRRFFDEAADLVVKYGGSLSGEHGDGQSRAALLPKMFGDELVSAFTEFKDIWDPDGGMNPGKVVRPNAPDHDLRWGHVARGSAVAALAGISAWRLRSRS